jgi:hypothetical protein
MLMLTPFAVGKMNRAGFAADVQLARLLASVKLNQSPRLTFKAAP